MKNSWVQLLVFLSCVAFSSGCALFVVGGAAAVGAGSYAYVNGESKEAEAAGLDKTWNATLAATKEMQLAVISQRKDAFSGEVTARTADDKKVVISLKRLSESNTELRVRVGTFGDEAMSRTITGKIRGKL